MSFSVFQESVFELKRHHISYSVAVEPHLEEAKYSALWWRKQKALRSIVLAMKDCIQRVSLQDADA